MDVKSASRTLDLFELFARAQQPLTLSEVAEGLDAPVSSCFNLVRVLRDHGFLFGIGPRRQVYPTRKMYELASVIATADPWLRRIQPTLEALRDATLETAILGKKDQDRVIYLSVLDGPQNIRYSARPGDLKPLHSSAIGKALLAAMTREVRTQTVARLRLEAMTNATIVNRKALLRDCEQAATRGYAITRGENVADVMALARTVSLGGDTYGIAVAGPMHRMDADIEKHLKRLSSACRKIGDEP